MPRSPFLSPRFRRSPSGAPPAATPPLRTFGFAVALVLTGFLAAGCSTTSSAGKTVSGWFGGGKNEATLYATIEGLVVRADPKRDAKVVGRLHLGEKVVRSKQKDGYALIRTRGGSLEGWVVDAKLGRRVSAQAGTGKPAAGKPGEETPAEVQPLEAADEAADAPAEEAAPEAAAAEAPAEAAPEPAPSPPKAPTPPPAKAPTGTKKGIGASVLDPY